MTDLAPITRKRIVVTGLGLVCAAGAGIEQTWQAICQPGSLIGPIQSLDVSDLPCQIGAEVRNIDLNAFVDKSYRKHTKVMSREMVLAVAAASLAAAAAGPEALPLEKDDRLATCFGASIISCDMRELATAADPCRTPDGELDLQRWGQIGLPALPPLWLLRGMPNLMASHVATLNGARGPSNTIVCGDASSLLAIGETIRVLQRGAADASLCGGGESCFTVYRMVQRHRTIHYNPDDNNQPDRAIRPFCQTAAGAAPGEGAAVLMVETLERFRRRGGERADAELLAAGAAQARDDNDEPVALARAIAAALRSAGIAPDEVDAVFPMGLGVPHHDRMEAAALLRVFGSARLASLPLITVRPKTGACGAADGAVHAAVAAKALSIQMLPAVVNCDQPLPGLRAGNAPARPATLRHIVVCASSLGGQHAAVVLRRWEGA